MEQFIEITKNEYKEVFEWLYEKEDVELLEELDISMAHTYNEPYIYYTKEIADIFNTKPMQRLQRILQLGTVIVNSENVYHTRLEHCKGAYRRAIEFIAVKYKDEDWKKYIEENNKKQELINTIIFMGVHDVGHSMLSHVLEDVVGNKDCNHELIGDKIIEQNIELSTAMKKARLDRKILRRNGIIM